jgi:hypothetical protein
MIRVAGHSRMTIDEAIADDPVSALAATDVPMDSDQNGNAGRNVNPSRA